MKPLSIGIIGAGRIGKLHAENIARHYPNVCIKAVADPHIDKDWANSQCFENSGEDHQVILRDPSIDAVLICSPSSTHAELVKEAAHAKKHIFCEKPIALDPTVIRDVISTVESAGVKLQVGFNRRFDPTFAEIQRQVAAGKIGEPHIIRITSRDPEPPSADYLKHCGGLFFDMTIHDFDMVRFLANSDVDTVFAMGNTFIHEKTDEGCHLDTAVVTLKFKSGALAVIDNSRQAVYGYDQRIEVFGNKGSLSAENHTATNTIMHCQESVTHSQPLYFFLERYEKSFIAEMGSFFDAIINDTQPEVTGYDGLIPVLLGCAANESLRTKAPVKVAY